MRATTADTVIAYITHDYRSKYIISVEPMFEPSYLAAYLAERDFSVAKIIKQ